MSSSSLVAISVNMCSAKIPNCRAPDQRRRDDLQVCDFCTARAAFQIREVRVVDFRFLNFGASMWYSILTGCSSNVSKSGNCQLAAMPLTVDVVARFGERARVYCIAST